MSFSSSRTRRDSPLSPGSDRRGACCTALAKLLLPRPPRPPAATTQVSPSRTRSRRRCPRSASWICVPTGTSTTRSAPFAPLRLRGPPGRPSSASWIGRRPTRRSELTLALARSTTLPPSPPLPPSGPPKGANFSRRNETAPSPPRPPRTSSSHSSRNTAGRPGVARTSALARVDVDAAGLEAHAPLDARVDRVVAAHAHVVTGMDHRPALAHDDRARSHELAAVALHAAVLGIGVAPVLGR